MQKILGRIASRRSLTVKKVLAEFSKPLKQFANHEFKAN